jgi:serine/threonine protein kinase
MGVVYECRHPLAPRPVAVKQILARAASEKAMARFLREAELLARLKHPSVVSVHQLGRTGDGPYLVMELVEGRPLDKALRDGPLAPEQAARLLRDLARAVAVVHAAGILHRDLKPANVIVRPDGTPVLLDFGLAREVDAERMTRTGEVLGTIAYMPPEQAAGKADLDGRVDVYSLGAILYELVTGCVALQGTTSLELLARIISGEPPPRPSEVREGVPAHLEAVIARAMAPRL